MLADERDHVAERLFDGVVEILIKTHGDPGVRLLGARGRELHVLAQMEFEGAGEGRLDRRQANLAVALHAVAVAGREQRAPKEDREIGRGANAELLVFHVAAEGPWLGRRQPPPAGRGCYAEIAE